MLLQWVTRPEVARYERQRNAIPFDENIWRTVTVAGDKWEREQEKRREYLVDDLLKRYDFMGLHRSNVEQMLGKPDHEIEEQHMTYYTVSMFFNYLYFRFDESNRVVKYNVVWDSY